MTFKKECAPVFAQLRDIENFGQWIIRMNITDLFPAGDVSDEQLQCTRETLETAALLYATRH